MNSQEFNIQVVPLKDKLFRFARRILENTEEAEDIVQDVFIRLWNHRDRLDEYRSVEALAMMTTKNLCLDKIKIKRYPVENLDDHRRFLENIPADHAPDYSEEIYRVKQAMKKLPRPQQMIVQLRDIEGYDFETIADIVEMTENAVRVNLSRARKRIRELIISVEKYEYQSN
jgi:RNA polymerase sigma-70 factor (ECF subfamily)